jgi:hypothetical protein
MEDRRGGGGFEATQVPGFGWFRMGQEGSPLGMCPWRKHCGRY